MLFTLKLVAVILSVHVLVARSEVPKGRAVWVYDVANGQPAMWSPAISSFNKNATYPIKTVYSYGGDMELYLGSSRPFQTYFTEPNQRAAEIYRNIEGVSSVILVIDGRMDGGESYSPDLSKLTIPQVKQWADQTAALYCSFPQVAGLQIDLEPFAPPYRANLLVFLSELSEDLLSADFDCRNERYPAGRVLSTFLLAEAATHEVYRALGPMGFAIISGYDLSDTPAGTPITPAEYHVALTSSIKQTLHGAGTQGRFSLGLPAAASTHEFLRFVRDNGTVVHGHPMWSNHSKSYLTEAHAAIKAHLHTSDPSFLGTSLWGFSSMMAYPPHSNNLFFPSNPFSTPGEQEWLKHTDL